MPHGGFISEGRVLHRCRHESYPTHCTGIKYDLCKCKFYTRLFQLLCCVEAAPSHCLLFLATDAAILPEPYPWLWVEAIRYAISNGLSAGKWRGTYRSRGDGAYKISWTSWALHSCRSIRRYSVEALEWKLLQWIEHLSNKRCME